MIKDLESFLGYVNYQRAHLKDISVHTSLLYDIVSEAKQLTKDAKSKKAYQNVKINFNSEQLQAFEAFSTCRPSISKIMASIKLKI